MNCKDLIVNVHHARLDTLSGACVPNMCTIKKLLQQGSQLSRSSFFSKDGCAHTTSWFRGGCCFLPFSAHAANAIQSLSQHEGNSLMFVFSQT
jgi:hypothetical protein